MQAWLPAAISTVKQLGFRVGLHTAGAFPKVLEQVLPLTDWVGMDIKAPFEAYEQVTGIPGSGESARMSAALVRTSGVSHQFRTTLDPWLLEDGRLERLQEMVTVGWGEKVVIQMI